MAPYGTEWSPPITTGNAPPAPEQVATAVGVRQWHVARLSRRGRQGEADNVRLHRIEAGRLGEYTVGEDNTVLLVLADKRADFDLVSKVLKTSGYAGFPNFRFAVLKK